MNLSSFTGNNSIKESLLGAVASGRLSHGLLLRGEKGMGVNHFALLLAADITNSYDIQAITEGKNPLVQVVKGEGAGGLIRVDKIRRINENVNFSSISGEKRVVIIHNRENFNLNSANALLKNLEEPKNDTTYILTTNNIRAILATIRSRCRVYTLHRPTKEEMSVYFSRNGYDMQAVQALGRVYGENIGKIKACLDSEKRYGILNNAMAVFNRAIAKDSYTASKICYGYVKNKDELKLLLEDLRDICHNRISHQSIKIINVIAKYTEILSTNANINLIIENLRVEIVK